MFTGVDGNGLQFTGTDGYILLGTSFGSTINNSMALSAFILPNAISAEELMEMVKRSLRSRSLRKLRVRVPGGKTVERYKGRKNAFTKCAVCKRPLSGMPKVTDALTAKLSISERRPDRKFGGNMCPSCSRKEIRKRLYESIQ